MWHQWFNAYSEYLGKLYWVNESLRQNQYYLIAADNINRAIQIEVLFYFWKFKFGLYNKMYYTLTNSYYLLLCKFNATLKDFFGKGLLTAYYTGLSITCHLYAILTTI